MISMIGILMITLLVVSHYKGVDDFLSFFAQGLTTIIQKLQHI